MAAVLVSAKVSVFLQQVQQDFPQVFPTVLLGTNTNYTQKHNQNRGYIIYLLANRSKKQGIKIKLGCLPTSAII